MRIARRRGNSWWLQRRGDGKFISREQQYKNEITELQAEYEEYAGSLSLELLSFFKNNQEMLGKIQVILDEKEDMNPIEFYKVFRDLCIEKNYLVRCPDCDGKVLRLGNNRCLTCEGRGYLARTGSDVDEC